MEKMKLYHNPRCSKSRDSFNWLTESKKEFETVEYLKNPPTEKEIKGLLSLLGIKASDLVRKGEADYKALFAKKDPSEAELIKAMAQNPKLIERPILIKGDKAVIGRPLEKVIDLAK